VEVLMLQDRHDEFGGLVDDLEVIDEEWYA
jgi:hypothetical protein